MRRQWSRSEAMRKEEGKNKFHHNYYFCLSAISPHSHQVNIREQYLLMLSICKEKKGEAVSIVLEGIQGLFQQSLE